MLNDPAVATEICRHGCALVLMQWASSWSLVWLCQCKPWSRKRQHEGLQKVMKHMRIRMKLSRDIEVKSSLKVFVHKGVARGVMEDKIPKIMKPVSSS